MKNLYCIVGPSGAGKTTIVEELYRRFGYKAVASYTTRPPRCEGEEGHVFVNDVQFDALTDKVAFTEFSGYRYCVTRAQLADCDLYVIDPAGIKELLRHDIGKQVRVIGICAGFDVLKERMQARGDAGEAIEKRLTHDKEAFKEMTDIADVVFQNNCLDRTIRDICTYIKEEENEGIREK